MPGAEGARGCPGARIRADAYSGIGVDFATTQGRIIPEKEGYTQ
jgi:hypothetical protein